MTPRGWLHVQVRVTTVLAAISALFLFVAPRLDTRDFSMLEALGPVEIETLRRTNSGTEVLVEGRIPPETRTARHDLVVSVGYLRQVSTASEDAGRLREREIERQTPPFDLQLSSGRIRIENEGYKVKQLPTVTDDGSLFRKGLAPGDPAVVIGNVRRNGDDVALRASVVAFGTQKSYVHNLKGGRRMNRKIGMFFAGAAALVLVCTSFATLRRARRREYLPN
jgi:hypothetical protein